MFDNLKSVVKPDDEQLKSRLSEARKKLYQYQQQIKEAGLPVLVLFEGWGTSGKGALIGSMIQSIDPRAFKVSAIDPPTEEERRKPFLCRYFEKIPEAGRFQILDSGWMDELTRGLLEETISVKEYDKRVESVLRFERTLTDNGYLVLKFFCHITEKEQKKRIEQLEEDVDTKWRVGSHDKWQNKHYGKCKKVYETYLKQTNTPNAPWYMIDAKSRKWALLQIMEIMNDAIEMGMTNRGKVVPIIQNTYPLVKMPKLADVSFEGKSLTEQEYDEKLKALQGKLRDLHNRLYRKKVPVVIAYEGWDAAGKGGNIKRITGALDPRGFEVNPIASPTSFEKSRHYLWRFWNKLPKTGHISIFDRTWYGRVMVERLEGYCSENDWKRAYNEINEFEKELSDWGAVIIKFWVHIDKDTQLERFNDRQSTPEKQWKITDEDWRNREKWDQYETAIDEMIEKTSTDYAPWYVLESVDKKYARIKALQIVVDKLEEALK